MYRVFGILLFILITGFSVSNSIGSVSVEKVIQKRIEMFKSSGKNIKMLGELIRSGNPRDGIQLLDFHVRWSENMPFLFPLGSEASTSNGSDASSDIWDDPIGFTSAIKQYNLASKDLKKVLKSADSGSIIQSFKSFVGTCKACHKQYRN